MNQQKKKLVVPIVVTVIVIVYFVFYFGFLIALLPGVWKYLLAIFPILFAAVTIMVCLERIREIKKGEEDDLSQY